MAVTGSGTQADPYIVHDYEEFISLSNTGATSGSSETYIEFQVTGNVIDCNTYGSEFKWGQFHCETNGSGAVKMIHINLNGTTIKNLIIEDGKYMFYGKNNGGQYGSIGKIEVSNGSIRNVFLGGATSGVAWGAVTFFNVSMSLNSTGATAAQFNGYNMEGMWCNFDNCALYLACATLNAPVGVVCAFTDTDLELHINNQNGIIPFRGSGDYGTYSLLTDCRIQGKIGGTPFVQTENGHCSVLGCATPYSSGDRNGVCKLVNCVVDLDLTDSVFDYHGAVYHIYKASGTTDLNTNVLCTSHYPSVGTSKGYTYQTDWNYMTHEQMRNAEYLNSKGFVVVDVSGS